MESSHPSYSAVAAMASNRVIGRDGELPWRIPGELKLFKELTTGHPVIMGRVTFDSLPGPLAGRRNIVVSQSLPNDVEGIEVVASLEGLEALGLSGTVFVIGGARIYEALLPRCESLYLTYVFAAHEGDAFFPEFERDFVLSEVLTTHDLYERRLYRRRS